MQHFGSTLLGQNGAPRPWHQLSHCGSSGLSWWRKTVYLGKGRSSTKWLGWLRRFSISQQWSVSRHIRSTRWKNYSGQWRLGWITKHLRTYCSWSYENEWPISAVQVLRNVVLVSSRRKVVGNLTWMDIFEYVAQNTWQCPAHWGFKTNSSRFASLLRLLDESKQVEPWFREFSKVFGSRNHRLLLLKLQPSGIQRQYVSQ